MDLSIIIPLYNGEKFIKSLLESLYQQNSCNINFELIIIDDCSTDSGNLVIHDFTEQNQITNLQYVKLDENKGTAKARNVGLSIASGKWIQFLDSDDQLPTNYFEKIEQVVATEDIDCYVYGVRYFHVDQIITHTPMSPIDSRMIGYKNIVVNKIYRRDILEKFEPDYTFEDVIWLVKLMSKSLKCKVIEGLYYHVNRENPDSKMANSKSGDWYKMAKDAVSQSKKLSPSSRQFVLETFVGTIFANKFMLRHRLGILIRALVSHFRYLPNVLTNGIRTLDNKSVKYKKK